MGGNGGKLMADDFQQAATGPLQGGGGQSLAPTTPNQGIIDKLLPIVIPALAAVAGSNKWAGPGAALTRGAVAGLAGYESEKPKQLTPDDQAHLALAQKYETENRIAQQQMKAQQEFLSGLPPDERTIAAADVPGYIKLKRDERLRGPLIQYLSQRYPDQIDPTMLAGMDNQHLQALGNGLTRDEYRSKQRGEKEYKPIKDTALVDPEDGHEIQPGEDAGKGVKVHVLRSPTDNHIIPGSQSGVVADKSEGARLDRSYKDERGRLTKLTAPVEQQAERMTRLIDSVNQHTPQADAFVAPEMLTAMAGGLGSGLRMNEAEISRIVGGRSKWESLQAALNQWKTDPTKATSITEPQREQIRALAKAMQDRIQKKLRIAHDAATNLVDAKSVDEHRRILNEAEKAISDEGTSQAPAEQADPLGIR